MRREISSPIKLFGSTYSSVVVVGAVDEHDANANNTVAPRAAILMGLLEFGGARTTSPTRRGASARSHGALEPARRNRRPRGARRGRRRCARGPVHDRAVAGTRAAAR